MVELKAPDVQDGGGERRKERLSKSGGDGNRMQSRLERLQVCVAKHIMDRCWDIASLDRVTVASLVEEALEREIRRRESERGEPYPRRRDWRRRRGRAQ